MKRLLYIAILATAVLLLCSCSAGQASNTPTLNANMGYVHIQGNTSGVDVFVNDVAQPIKFDKVTHTTLLQLTPGIYQIKIQRNGMDLVNEQIRVTATNTSEVIVP